LDFDSDSHPADSDSALRTRTQPCGLGLKCWVRL